MQLNPIKSILLILAFIFSFSLMNYGGLAKAMTTMSQGYSTKESIPMGSIVSLEDNSNDHVIASTHKTSDGIIGVVIGNNNSVIALSNGQENQVQVATSGIVSVLVSDINGTIKKGDQITSSPIKGVGMKANSNVKVVGVAQTNPINNKKETYKDSSGNDKTVNLSEISVLVNVTYYFKEPEKTVIPNSIQYLANAIAGKAVEPLPIIISGAIFIITIIVVVSIIYSMIKNSIVSIGRNPMSQSAVYRDLIQLSLLVLGILAVALISIYVILARL